MTKFDCQSAMRRAGHNPTDVEVKAPTLFIYTHF